MSSCSTPPTAAGSLRATSGRSPCRSTSPLVAGRDPAVLLQAVDQPLDPVPEPVRLAVEAGPAALALLGRGDRRDAATPELPPGLRAAVGLVARHPPGQQARPAPALAPDRARVEHRLQRHLLVLLAAGKDDSDRPAIALSPQVDLGREAASGAAERLVRHPPFSPDRRAPAAGRCARAPGGGAKGGGPPT